ncbi:MAG: hypothetical protein ACPL7D_12520 [Candidatus Sumerlaeaceae bacterium]
MATALLVTMFAGTTTLACAAWQASHHAKLDAGVWPSILIGFLYWFHIAAGGLAFLMIQYLTGGAWGVMGRRLFETASITIPLFAIPVAIITAIGLPQLYEWARPEALSDPILVKKAAYLNVSGFALRGIIYFLVWTALALILVRFARPSIANQQGVTSPRQKCARVSGPGVVLYGLTMTFASIDWVMSLEPHWYSSLFGGLFVAGQLLSALAFSIVVLALLANRQEVRAYLGKRHFHDFGKLLLAFVMLWAYLSFSQFLIIWSGNLAEEAPYYLKRLRGGWQVVALALIVAHFALPFLILLSKNVKRQPTKLMSVAVFILIMRFLDIEYMVRPAITAHLTSAMVIADLLAIGAFGLVWIVLFGRLLMRTSILPFDDPAFVEAVEHGKH